MFQLPVGRDFSKITIGWTVRSAAAVRDGSRRRLFVATRSERPFPLLDEMLIADDAGRLQAYLVRDQEWFRGVLASLHIDGAAAAAAQPARSRSLRAARELHRLAVAWRKRVAPETNPTVDETLLIADGERRFAGRTLLSGAARVYTMTLGDSVYRFPLPTAGLAAEHGASAVTCDGQPVATITEARMRPWRFEVTAPDAAHLPAAILLCLGHKLHEDLEARWESMVSVMRCEANCPA